MERGDAPGLLLECGCVGANATVLRVSDMEKHRCVIGQEVAVVVLNVDA